MAKRLKQFVYYKDKDEVTTPAITDEKNPWTTNLFSEYSKISHLGIQGPKNIYFSLNNSDHWIAIGSTGIYEIDLGGGYIHGLKFQNLEMVTDKILVDFIYEDEGVL